MTARRLTDADVDAIADAVAARLGRAPFTRRVREPGRARLPAAEAARRAAVGAGEIDEVTRARVKRAMRKAGVR